MGAYAPNNQLLQYIYKSVIIHMCVYLNYQMEAEVSTLKNEKETLQAKLITSQGEKAGMIIIINYGKMRG